MADAESDPKRVAILEKIKYLKERPDNSTKDERQPKKMASHRIYPISSHILLAGMVPKARQDAGRVAFAVLDDDSAAADAAERGIGVGQGRVHRGSFEKCETQGAAHRA